MNKPFPIVVTVVLLICTGISLSGEMWNSAIYNRGLPEDMWRFFTASFTHYDFKHLITNLVSFTILGVMIEAHDSSQRLIVIILATIVSTMLCLHFYLQEYQVYAGLSGVNYALMGYILMDRYRYSPWKLYGLLLLIGAYQLANVSGGEAYSSDLPRPVWQIHILALVIGGYLRKRGRRDYFLYSP